MMEFMSSEQLVAAIDAAKRAKDPTLGQLLKAASLSTYAQARVGRIPVVLPWPQEQPQTRTRKARIDRRKPEHRLGLMGSGEEVRLSAHSPEAHAALFRLKMRLAGKLDPA